MPADDDERRDADPHNPPAAPSPAAARTRIQPEEPRGQQGLDGVADAGEATDGIPMNGGKAVG